jgi:prepilin-type N-terminal cleavage/methylation domain-containing protein
MNCGINNADNLQRNMNTDPRFVASGTGKRILAFTLIELLVVISIIGLLAGMTVGVARLASEKMRRERIKGELDSYVTAIEAYKAKFGCYPQDNLQMAGAGRGDRSAPNPLFYELTGVIYTNNTFLSPLNNERMTPVQLGQFFLRNGFVNAGEQPREIKNFLPSLKPSQVKSMTNFGPLMPSVTVLAVPVQTVKAQAGDINSWHYISTNPTNNPNTFDLWAEFAIGKQTVVVGNWKQ